SYYQAWTIMQNNGVSIDQINYESVRIVFEPPQGAELQEIVAAHYNIYASVISNFPERNDSKRDYVITPKRNGFRALVFQVMFEGHWVEIQIVTSDDDMVAHRGYSYKRPNRKGLDELRTNLQRFNKDQDAVELINRFRSLSSLVTIFVFTPKGSIVELPQGSTVLDFAYSIHSRLGNHCLGAIVGQQIVPLNHVLKTTDKVNVLTSPSAKPSSDWFRFVKSDHARTCLEKYFKRNTQSDKSEIIKGKQDFNKLLRDNRIIPTLLLSGRILAYYKMPNVDEFYRSLARQEIKIEDLWNCIKRIKKIIDGNADSQNRAHNHEVTDDHVPLLSPKRIKNQFIEINYKKPLLVEPNMPFVLSPCCNPIAGDDALCTLDDEGILYIHKRECVNARLLAATQGKKNTTVLWSPNLDPMMATLKLQGSDRIGLVKDVACVLEDNKINVKSISMSENDGIFTGVINLMIKNVDVLNNIIKVLMGIQGIVKVNRVSSQISN
ncbi:MAG: TGS domain-containing protein, partial [Bacteroidales bacterium]|nr:TGS domain-containing protein [Bacteroidales bacterium]